MVRDRRLVVAGALLVQLCLGSIYAWSVFTAPLQDPEGEFRFSVTQTQIIFSVGLGTFAALMPFAGRLQAEYGPRRVTLLGGLLLGAGYVLAGLLGRTFTAQMLTIGLLGGAGVGLAYVCPIAVGMRWFPDRKGLITGLAVAGFGFGALLWVQLAGPWGHLIETMGVLNVFIVYGILFAALVWLGSACMVYPPAGWRPAGWNVEVGEGSSTVGPVVEMLPGEMLRVGRFYSIWLSFAFCALAGLMVIGIAMLFGRDALAASGLAKYAEPKVAETAASTAYAVFFALANGFGRIGWGLAADRLGWKRSIVTMASAQAIAIAGLYHLGSSFPALCLLLAVIGANFGGTLALFPLATAGSFGTANVGQNYGFMFTAYGVGGLLGPIAAGLFKDLGRDLGVEAWRPPLMLASALCLGAASIIWRVGDRDASPPPTRARAARHPLPPDQQVSAADAGAVSSRFTIQSERR